MYHFLKQVWPLMALAVWTLGGIEGSRYLVGLALQAHGAWFFVGTGLFGLLGFFVCRRHGDDVGVATSQLYLIDFAWHVVGLLICLYLPVGPMMTFAAFLYKSVNVGLDFAKILAVASLLSLPDQPGWPTLIPFAAPKRKISGNNFYDKIIYVAVALSMVLGGLIVWQGASHVMLYFSYLAIILVIIVRSQNHAITTKAGKLSPRALDIAYTIDTIPALDVREMVLNNISGIATKLATANYPDLPPDATRNKSPSQKP